MSRDAHCLFLAFERAEDHVLERLPVPQASVGAAHTRIAHFEDDGQRVFGIALFIQNRHWHLAHDETPALIPTVLFGVESKRFYCVFRCHISLTIMCKYSLPDFIGILWTVPDSNRSPPHCKCGALPNELTAPASSKRYQNKAFSQTFRAFGCLPPRKHDSVLQEFARRRANGFKHRRKRGARVKTGICIHFEEARSLPGNDDIRSRVMAEAEDPVCRARDVGYGLFKRVRKRTWHKMMDEGFIVMLKCQVFLPARKRHMRWRERIQLFTSKILDNTDSRLFTEQIFFDKNRTISIEKVAEGIR